MEAGKPHKNYTRADLARYLQGGMSPAEMHQLEKDALDDPFLAEALEGLLDFSGPDPLGQLEQLDARWEKEWDLQEQQPAAAASQPIKLEDDGNPSGTDVPAIPTATPPTPARAIPFYQKGWFRAAAAILLLLGIGLVMNRMFNDPLQEKNSIAETKEKVEVSDPANAGANEALVAQADSLQMSIAQNQSPVGKPNADAASELKQEESISPAGKELPEKSIAAAEPARSSSTLKDSRGKADSISRLGQTSQPLAEAAPPPVSVVSAEANKARKQEISPRDIVSAESNREASGAPASANARRLKSAQPAAADARQGAYLFRGQVTDKDNRPLSFVNLRMPNGGLNTYTDARGYYRIFSADSSIQLELKAVGYQLKRTALHASRPDEKIVMQLAEGKQKTASPRASVPEEMTREDEGMTKQEDERPDVEPADGWAAYQYYLLNNLRMPADALQSKLHGTVEVSFLVSADGKRSGYRVEKSLSPSCDREAVRLVRDGPSWTVYNSEQSLRARVTVVF